MRTVCIIQARMGSTRLPGKVLKPLAGKPALWHVVDRTNRCTGIDDVVIATTTEPADQRIAEYCAELGWNVFRGSQADVLERYHEAAIAHAADVVIRVTSDCPLIDPSVVDRLVGEFASGRFDYMSTNYPTRTFPVGCDCEIMTFAALGQAHRLATTPYDREHVTPYLYTHPERFSLGGIAHVTDRSDVRLTLDTMDDYRLLAAIYDRHYRDGEIISLDEAVAFYDARPDL